MKFYGQTLTELQPEISYDPQSGYSVARRWQGSHDEIETAAFVYRELNYRTEPQHPENGGYSSLRVYFSAPDNWSDDRPLADKWTRKGNDLEKSLWYLPKVRAEFNKIDMTEPVNLHNVVLFKNDVESYVKGERSTTTVDGKKVNLDWNFLEVNARLGLGIDSTVIRDLIGALARGEESFPVSQTVLMRTLIVHGNSSIKANKENIDKIFTTNGLKASLPIPETIKFELEDGFWLKKTPTTEQIASDKFEINYEWWFAEQYDKFIYGEPIV
jgi:hypothetical protein